MQPASAGLRIEQALAVGVQHHQARRLREAERIYRQILNQRPDHADAIQFLALLLNQTGRGDEALQLMHRAVQLKPMAAEYVGNLGLVYAEQGRLQEAIGTFRHALALRPDFPEARYNLGRALQELDQVDEAIECFQETLRLRPNFADAHFSLANALKDCGQVSEAMASYRQALACRPIAPYASNLVYATYFQPHLSPRQILEEHLAWARVYAQPLVPRSGGHVNDRRPDRRLRIGYVSPDFRQHVLASYHIPLLANHDRHQVEVICYSDVRRPDAITERIRGLADTWHDVTKLSDADLAQQIRADQIDILVDLAMHMAGNRQLAFARKPAPVQLCWSYPGTTGNPGIDYRLTDAHIDPAGQHDDHHSEQSIRLPDSFFIYDPLATEPPVNPLPAASRRYITFGCLNNFAKVNEDVLALWAGMLSVVTQSRMLLMTPAGKTRQRAIECFAAIGVRADRIEFVSRQPRDRYFQLYHEIDLCLDTFPYTGHTTTMDAAWMGVPTISLVGQTAASRGALSILSNLGLAELACDSPEQYERTAIHLAQSISTLQSLRATLRNRLSGSPLMDGRRFACNIEAIYRALWRAWCAA
jgi:predicted O-linked N-acetylglucosamine transferase (SPINDLY family)